MKLEKTLNPVQSNNEDDKFTNVIDALGFEAVCLSSDTTPLCSELLRPHTIIRYITIVTEPFLCCFVIYIISSVICKHFNIQKFAYIAVIAEREKNETKL